MRELACDVLVIGAGPAGLAAAATAAEGGSRVVVVDENPEAGGQIWRSAMVHGPHPETSALAARALARGARFLTGATVVDAAGANTLFAVDGAGPIMLRAGRLVLALGATERFLPFPGWTLPGVFGVGGLQALAKNGLEIGNRTIAVAGSGPLLLAVAAWLEQHGAHVLGVFEQAPKASVVRFGLGLWRHPRKLAQAVALLRVLRQVPRHHDAWPLRAEGDGYVERVTFSVSGSERTLQVDYLACAFGLAPTTGLGALLGCDIAGGGIVVDALQHTSIPEVLCAGESTGIGGVDCALAEGVVAGHVASGHDDRARAACRRRDRERGFAETLGQAYALRHELRGLPSPETIICRCEDVPWSVVAESDDVRDAKLKTRAGMGPCQGRVCGGALEFLKRWPRDSVRPPLIPITLGELAEVGAALNRTEDQTR
ncbi:MAG: FAD-dependent oxidoreductase [Gemmatimonadales bacterium]|nr:FAD-dependent oxidoreductase [Gemmatimonadales bacterium]